MDCGSMALHALHAYDSDSELDDIIISNNPDIATETVVETDLIVEQVIEYLLLTVSILEQESQNADPVVSSFVPDFRASVNECEISIDSSSSSSSWSLSSEECVEESQVAPSMPWKGPRTKGELLLDELPLIQRLAITAQVEELSHIGRVANILDRLVTIVSFRCLPPLDLESVLFSKDGRALGPIFDVFGPVKEPRYVLRFNSQQEVTESGVTVDMPVYYAPNLPYTSYVFTSELMAIRGSDASWKHDNEPPEEVKEYSDDEEERRDKQRFKRKTIT